MYTFIIWLPVPAVATPLGAHAWLQKETRLDVCGHVVELVVWETNRVSGCNIMCGKWVGGHCFGRLHLITQYGSTPNTCGWWKNVRFCVVNLNRPSNRHAMVTQMWVATPQAYCLEQIIF